MNSRSNPPADPSGLLAVDPMEVDRLLAELPAPLEPFDACALDGFLVGLLLQPQRVETSRWLPYVFDQDGRAVSDKLAARLPLAHLQALAERRHAELNRAIVQRQWFDPWVFELDDEAATAAEAVLPWIAGWAAALDLFPALLHSESPALREPLATLFAYFDPDDLDDVDDIADLLAEMAPADTLEDAVEDLVRSSLLIADVSRPVRDVRPPVAKRKTAHRPSALRRSK